MERENKSTMKSWCLNIETGVDEEAVRLCAVDSETGNPVTAIMTFHNDGKVYAHGHVFESLLSNGYNPREYNNKYEPDGGLVIDVPPYGNTESLIHNP